MHGERKELKPTSAVLLLGDHLLESSPFSDIVTQSLFIRIAMIQTSQNYEKIKKQRGFWREASFVLRNIGLTCNSSGVNCYKSSKLGGVYKNVVFEKTIPYLEFDCISLSPSTLISPPLIHTVITCLIMLNVTSSGNMANAS